MNNNFVVSIPSNLKLIQSKLLFGLTKRQLIGVLILVATTFPLFMILKEYSIDLAMYGLFIVGFPIIFGTIFTKDGMATETWIKLYLDYKFLSPLKRKYKLTKENRTLAMTRNMLRVRQKNDTEERDLMHVEKTEPVSSSS
jgi:hypothetical protein